MLNFHFTQIVQQWLPATVLVQVFGYALGKQDVSGIAAIHDALGHVDARARDVDPAIHVDDFIHGTAVNTHPNLNFGMTLERLADLQCTLHRRGGIVEEHERHTVAGGNAGELIQLSRFGNFGRIAHQLLQGVQHARLFVDWQSRITHDVHEQDMSQFHGAAEGILKRHFLLLLYSSSISRTIKISGSPRSAASAPGSTVESTSITAIASPPRWR